MDTVTVAEREEFSIAEAASFAGVSTRTLRRAIAEGKLPRRYISTAHGAQLSLPRHDLEHWLAERTEEEAGQADTSLSIGQKGPDVASLLTSLVQQHAEGTRQGLAVLFAEHEETQRQAFAMLLSQWADSQREALTEILSTQQQALPVLLASAQEPLLARVDAMQDELIRLRQELAAERAKKRPWWKFWTKPPF